MELMDVILGETSVPFNRNHLIEASELIKDYCEVFPSATRIVLSGAPFTEVDLENFLYLLLNIDIPFDHDDMMSTFKVIRYFALTEEQSERLANLITSQYGLRRLPAATTLEQILSMFEKRQFYCWTRVTYGTTEQVREKIRKSLGMPKSEQI